MSRKEIRPVYDVNTKVWFSEKEAVFYTSFGRDLLLRARQEGKLTFRKYGSKIIYHRDNLDKFIERHSTIYESGDDLKLRTRRK